MFKAAISLGRLFSIIVTHPLNQRAKVGAIGRWFRWQISSRLAIGPTLVPFVAGTRLVARNGLTAATLNIYLGLSEFNDMMFLLHYLREDDLFIDIGSNIGAYSVLATGVAKGRAVAIEPVPTTFELLRDNIQINRLQDVVELQCCGIGDEPGELRFTADSDATNHVAVASEEGIIVPIRRLDDIVAGRRPSLIKIDVEGFELKVLHGAAEALSTPELALIIEINGLSRRYGVEPETTVSELAKLGFKPYHYDALSRSLQPQAIPINDYKGNLIFVSDPATARERLTAAPKVTVRDYSL